MKRRILAGTLSGLFLLASLGIFFWKISQPDRDSTIGQKESKWERTELSEGSTPVSLPSFGDEIGNIQIPSLHLNEPLYYGTDLSSLKKGVCLSEEDGDWSLPGGDGRTLISCHNDKAFRRLHQLKTGEEITVATSGAIYRYEVLNSYESKEEDWNQNAYYNTPEKGLTLSTCYPHIRGTKDNWIVNCRLITDGIYFFTKQG